MMEKQDDTQETQEEKDTPLPSYVQTYLEGLKVPTNFDGYKEKPLWFDDEKFKRGQRIARENLFSLMFAEILAILLCFSAKTSFSPLIFTNKSDTAFKAFKRYLSSILKTKAWYDDDPWDKTSNFYKSMTYVKRVHASTSKQMNELPTDQLLPRVTLNDRHIISPKIIQPMLMDDFQLSCPVLDSRLARTVEGRTWFSQSDMAVTQFAFAPFLALYPKQFGMHHVTNEDLEDLLYLWRCLGYLHGIEDKYNICMGSLEDVRIRSREMINYSFKPSLSHIDFDWEHMSRCLINGLKFYVQFLDLEICLTYLSNVLEIEIPQLKRSLNWFQKSVIAVLSFAVDYLCRVRLVYTMVNKLVLWRLGQAKNASNAVLERMERSEVEKINKYVRDSRC